MEVSYGSNEKSGRATGRSALPSTADFIRGHRHVSKVPTADKLNHVMVPRKKPAAIGVKAGMPDFIEPGARWLHEIKFDGYRVQVHLRDAAVKVFTRRGKPGAGASTFPPGCNYASTVIWESKLC